jgi:hypothetical protein
MEGLIPVGWYPGAIVFSPSQNLLCVANIKGLPLTREPSKDTGAPGFNSHQYNGSVSLIPVHGKRELEQMSTGVEQNYRRPRIALALLPPTARPTAPARAGADRRAQRVQACRLYHQREPDL